MLLARTGRRQIFLGVLILTLTTIAQAVSVVAVKDESKPSTQSSTPTPASVLEPGSRLFAGDSEKNEFYILREDEPDPVIGPAFVNTQPLQAGIDADNLLTAKPSDTVNINNLLEDQASVDESVPLQAEQAGAQHKEQPAETHDNTNLIKLKTILHQMTRKMAVKKTYSRFQLASAAMEKKLASLQSQSRMKRAVAERHVNKKLRNKTKLAVVKVKYIYLG